MASPFLNPNGRKRKQAAVGAGSPRLVAVNERGLLRDAPSGSAVTRGRRGDASACLPGVLPMVVQSSGSVPRFGSSSARSTSVSDVRLAAEAQEREDCRHVVSTRDLRGQYINANARGVGDCSIAGGVVTSMHLKRDVALSEEMSVPDLYACGAAHAYEAGLCLRALSSRLVNAEQRIGEAAAVSARLAAVEAECDKHVARVAKLEGAAVMGRTAIASLESRVAELERDAAADKHYIAQLEQQGAISYADMQAKLEAVEAEAARLRADNERLRGDLDVVQGESTKFQLELAGVRADWRNVEKRIDEYDALEAVLFRHCKVCESFRRRYDNITDEQLAMVPDSPEYVADDGVEEGVVTPAVGGSDVAGASSAP